MSYNLRRIENFDWLGLVPDAWEIGKFKYLFDVSSEKNGWHPVGKMLSVSGYRGIEIKEYEDDSLMRTTEELVDYRVVRPGQLVVNTMWLNYAGLGVSEHTGYVSPAYRSYYIDEKLYPRFVHHLMRSEIYVRGYIKYMQGIRPNSLQIKTDDFNSFPVIIPLYTEQQQIAAFLDHETAKIDTLIEKQQKLITLLKEKRQAVISHAVTKGLNPDAPMKDSGVEWLGEVPAHWIVKRLKHISPKIGVGLVINPSTYTRDEGVYFIFGGDVKEYRFDLSNTRRMSPDDSNNLLPSRLNHHDLVCVRVGYPGVTAVVPKELEGANCASVIVIRRGNYNSDWLCAAMNTWVGRQQVDLASYGAAQKQFNVADAAEFVFPVPINQEQKSIADFVGKELDRFNKLTEKTEFQIHLLQERRTALISAAVTGKIDVRDWQPPPN